MAFDGACREGNPGRAAGGAVIQFPPLNPNHPEWSRPLILFGEPFRGTNNEAEYRGLLLGLHAALKHGVRHLAIRGDSKLVVMQVRGEWACRKDHLNLLLAEALLLLKNFDSWTIAWVPREQNKAADAAANQALDRK